MGRRRVRQRAPVGQPGHLLCGARGAGAGTGGFRAGAGAVRPRGGRFAVRPRRAVRTVDHDAGAHRALLAGGRAGGEQHRGFLRRVAGSMVASGDMAHATHPNYPDRHEPGHWIEVNGGPVPQVQPNLRYATDGAPRPPSNWPADGPACRCNVTNTVPTCRAGRRSDR